MITKNISSETTWVLRKAFKNKRAPIWKHLENELANSRSHASKVNISKLASVTKEGETIVVPGKILGSGRINHKLTVCAFSMSQKAAKKLNDCGGKIVTIADLTQSYPEGKGVRIIG
ncbi:MAG: 50S ribosomal protein L18e [Nitrososphaeraceae archaeon]